MIKIADLEAKIRELAGEIAILHIRESGLKDDIAALQQKVTELTPAKEESDGGHSNPKRRNS